MSTGSVWSAFPATNPRKPYPKTGCGFFAPQEGRAMTRTTYAPIEEDAE